MIPWQQLDHASTPDGAGELSLHRRGDEYSIRIDRRELMNSRQHGSEEAMASLACASLARADRPRVLVGGLGMGFTLAATTACLPASASVDVAELSDAVIRWNRGPLRALAGDPLADGRVQVEQGDIRYLLERCEGRYDAILLDVDNGPEGLTQASNEWLYGRPGLARLGRALASRGVLSVWSASSDKRFTKRLRAAGFDVQTHRVRARAPGKGPMHTIWVGRKTTWMTPAEVTTHHRGRSSTGPDGRSSRSGAGTGTKGTGSSSPPRTSGD